MIETDEKTKRVVQPQSQEQAYAQRTDPQLSQPFGAVPFYVIEKDVWIAGSNAATSANWPMVSIPSMACFLLEARLRYDAAGVAGSSLGVYRINSGSGRGSGVLMLESTFSLSATAGVVYTKGPTATLDNAQVDPTSKHVIELVAGGDISTLSDVVLTLTFGVLPRSIPTSKNV